MTRTVAVLLVLALGSTLLSAIRPVWTIDPDAGIYVGLGRAVATGAGYALDGVPHTKYPPGLPVLIAGLIRIGGAEAYGLFHATLVLAVLASVALAYTAVRCLDAPVPVALAVAAATGLSQSLFDVSVQYVRTEPLFLALTLGALLALWRCQRAGAGWGSAVLAAGLVAAACLTRLAGVTLLSVPVLAIVRREAPRGARWRLLLPAAAGLAVIVAWQLRAADIHAHDPRAVDYGAEFFAAEPRDLTKTVRLDMPHLDAMSLAHRVAGNFVVMARAMPVLLANVDSAGSRLPVGLFTLLFVVWGLATLAWGRKSTALRRQAAAYVAANFVVYLLWPFNQQERFYLPLLPLLVLSAGFGLLSALERARVLWDRPLARRVGLVVAAALLTVLAAQRSDHPVVLGRWSVAYAGLLALGVAGWIFALRAERLPAPRAAFALAYAAAIAMPFAHKRFVEWPARVEAFQQRRAATPRTGALARIDVDPRLEAVAVFLDEHTPPETVLMTDVPSILSVLSGRRCVPFVYRAQPPEVDTTGADFVFYTRELPDASAAMDAAAISLRPALQLEPFELEGRLVTPTVYHADR